MQTGLKIYTSNRLEILARKLAQIVSEPLSSPFTQEVIVVQSLGMERWISMELAKLNGISANFSFPFPNYFLQDIFKKIIPDLPDFSPFEPSIMTFKIMKILPGCLEKPEFDSLKTYLKDDTNKLKLFQLSEKIADTFDQYLVFRPDIIFKWEEGGEENIHAHSWQAHLWRKLVQGNEKKHRAWLRKIVFEKIRKREALVETFPERVSIFGISYLPPFHLQAFTQISQLVEVNFFILNPCLEYWADIVSDIEIKKIKGKYSHEVNGQDDLHMEKGNRLLASMGALGRDFFNLISGFDCEIHEQFEDQSCHNLLSCIQSDILYLREHNKDQKNITISKNDFSIQVNSCHSPMREIEILHDHLLAMFEEDPELLPKDIIVMTPDIEKYAPFVHVVFDAQTDEALRIPFGIADQSIRKESLVIDNFLSILDLKGSRFKVAPIMSLLESPLVKEKFFLTNYDVEIAQQWIKDTNIRWGFDGSDRKKLGLPGFNENTWKAGIERLLLGYAMPGQSKNMFSGILPYDQIEGNSAKVLGKLLEFLDCIFKWAEKLEQLRTLSSWGESFIKIIDQFFSPNEETEREMHLLRRTFDDLAVKEKLSEYNGKIELEVIKSYFDNCFKQEYYGSGFISKGVTFCAMLPMRSIPFKAVCLVGMDNDAFPREYRPLGFDLIARHPRPGDRSRRNDDKYLFLEAVISAQKKLYISYVGQSIQDNTKIEPSVMLSELIDYIEKGFNLPDNFTKNNLITHHRLQAFSTQYFKEDSKLFSYSRENFLAGTSFIERGNQTSFIKTSLSTPTDEFRNLEIETLCAFFSHPVRFLLQRRLGIYLDESTDSVDEKENFSINGLEKYKIEQDLLKSRLSGLKLDDMLPVQRATGTLPHGNIGKVRYREMSIDAEIFANKLENITEGKKLNSLDIDYEIAGFKIAGKITDIHEQRLIIFRYATVKPKDYLRAWIYHLLLCTIGDSQYPLKTTLLGSNLVYEFDPVQNPEEILEFLLQVYWKGLSEPVRFFPVTSYEYARQILINGKSKSDALNLSDKKWNAGYNNTGESKDPYFDLCFRETDPMDYEFEKISLEVFDPILDCGREVK